MFIQPASAAFATSCHSFHVNLKGIESNYFWPCMTSALTNAQIRFLRGQAHDLRPILQTGNKGVTESFLAELQLALEQHELVKVKVTADDRDTRNEMVEHIVSSTGASLVQRIGHTAVLYRPSQERRHIVLPRA